MREIFRATKGKVIATIFLALILIVISFVFPSTGLAARLAASSFWIKAISIFLSYVVSFIIYYPLICGIWTIIQKIKGNPEVKSGQVIISIVLILIFNPFSLSYIINSISGTNRKFPTPTPCAWGVAKFAKYSKAYTDGLRAGDTIRTINGKDAKTLATINTEALTKKVGEKIEVVTDRGTYQVEIVANPQTKKGTLGLLLAPVNCKK